MQLYRAEEFQGILKNKAPNLEEFQNYIPKCLALFSTCFLMGILAKNSTKNKSTKIYRVFTLGNA